MKTVLGSVALASLFGLTGPLAPAAVLPAVSPVHGGERFGSAVSSADVNGDGFADVIVGEPFFDGKFSDAGRVLVYHGSELGLATTPAWTARGEQPWAHFGAAVAGAVDVDGDGFEDVVIGAPDHDRRLRRASSRLPAGHLPTDEGRIYVYLGSASGLRANPRLVRDGSEVGEHFGSTVASAGDVDGDGYDDVLVAAPGTSANRGSAHVFHGSTLGPESAPGWSIVGSQPDARFGAAVAGAGDLDGDGYDDVLVGAPDAGGLGAGWVFVYLGAPGGLPPFASQILFAVAPDPSPQPPGDFGAGLAFLDLDADGYDDVLVGDPLVDTLGGAGGPYEDGGTAWVTAVPPPAYRVLPPPTPAPSLSISRITGRPWRAWGT